MAAEPAETLQAVHANTVPLTEKPHSTTSVVQKNWKVIFFLLKDINSIFDFIA